ncbi:MAG: Nramp family divalent metal transporter [Candidatus Tectomicrobia bacterium]|nr:Nramp family divalent metal transporter [Candidatus Tectomicrobia bacterium]
MAILLQTLSAKLGIVTGRSLPENCHDQFSHSLNIFLWITAELAAMATDLAEFLGGALGFHLLFGIPMFPAALLTGAVISLILALEQFGYKKVEYLIIIMVALINLAYLFEVYLAQPDWSLLAYHTVVPTVTSEHILIIVGIIGATVMPHNLYLHSGLVLNRLTGQINSRRLLRFAFIDSIIALNGAWLVNSAILIMSAATFHRHGLAVASIEEAHRTLEPLLGPLSSLAFAIALLASGLSSSTTATMAGQIIMGGFLKVSLSIWVRRLVTMIPALVVIALQVDPLKILVISQVSLSFQLPFAIVPLILFTARRDLMGEYVNRPVTNILAVTVTILIIALNMLLLYETVGGTF